MSIKINTRGLDRLLKKINRTPSLLERELDEAVQRYGHALLEAVRRHASGRPGPNAVTGAYRNAMVLEFRDGGAFVSNQSEQTRRLEYGFVGVDSLGRMYNQPPYPHFAPALAEVRPKFRADVAGAPLRAWRKA